MSEPPAEYIVEPASRGVSEISIGELLAVLRRQRRAIWLTPAVLLVVAIVYLHLAEPRYSVTLKVTPTASASTTIPAGLSGLADLTGLAIPAASENFDFDLYLEGLKSRETSAAVAANAELVRRLFPEDWDAAAGDWRRPPGLLSRVADVAKAVVGITERGWRPPDAERVNEFLDEELRIVRDRSGPVVTILLEHEDPPVARDLLAFLHHSVDTALRQKELDRTGAYVAYLREQLSNVAVTEYRQALHDILAEQEKRRMVASSNLPFAAEPFGQPTVSVHPTAPRPLFVIGSSLLLGILLGVVAAFWLHRRERESIAAA